MFAFSEAIASGKTADQAVKDETEKMQKVQQAAKQANEQRQQYLAEQAAIVAQEAEQQQQADDLNERHELAKKYEQMMIEDEKKEGMDNGRDNFSVLADQKAEQDYAINVFKGSGNMSDTFDKIKEQSEKERKANAVKKAAKKEEEIKLYENTPNAEVGESLIKGDSAAMFEFSSMAAQAAAQS